MTRVSIIQVGLGLWGRSWADVVATSGASTLAAVVDSRAEARREVARARGVPAFASLAAALAAVEADAVLLVSPPATHRLLAEESLAGGRHVVIEKPLAPTLADAAAVAEAASRAGRRVMVAQNYRFRRQSRALRELVRGGALGPLLGIRVACRRDLRDAWISRRDWRGRMAHPYLFDMAVHHVDLLRALTGREVTQVDARAWRVPDAPFRHEPSLEAMLDLEGDIPVAYEGTWAAPYRETSWNGDWEIVGSRARATWTGGVADALRGTVRVQRYGEAPARAALPSLPAVDRSAVLHELARAIRAGDEPECSAADNLRTLATVLALARSIEERRAVRVAEVAAG